MNVLIKYYVLLKLVTELCSVSGYTVLLKPVLPLYPAVRVYKYDVRYPKLFKEPTTQYIQHTPPPVQRIYPVYVKNHQNHNFRTLFPIKKEKRKYKIKVSPTTEKFLPREQKLQDLQQELVPPVSNQLEEYTESREELEEEPVSDISLTASGFFDGERFPSFGGEQKRQYNRPGGWAVKDSNTDSDNSTESNFTPSQLYLQVRHKNTVIHVPQSEALKDAETLEELINAPRLKELARITHVQEMYSEEGYEDAAYDHAGHIRHAQHGEVYDAKDEGKFNIKDPPIILDYDSDRKESEIVHNPKLSSSENVASYKNSYGKPYQNETSSKTNVGNASVVVTTPTPRFFKKEHMYTSSVKQPLKIDTFIQNTYINSTDNEVKSLPSTTPAYIIKRSQISTENSSVEVPNDYLKPPPPKNFSSKYRQKDMNSTRVFKTTNTFAPQTSNFTDLEPPLDSQPSPSAKSLKYSRVYSKKTKHLRLEPFKTGTVYKPVLHSSTYLSVPTDKPVVEEVANQRIVLPTIGYINSLTTAHFGKGTATPSTEESKIQLTKPLNLTQALNYLRSNKREKPEKKSENIKKKFTESEPEKKSENIKKKSTESEQEKKSENTKKKFTESAQESDISFFEPKRLKAMKVNTNNYGKTKRDVFLTGEKHNSTEMENYEGNDESDLPHNEKNKEIEEDEKKRIEEENVEKDKYEKDLEGEISDVEKEVLKETYKNIGVKEDISEVFPDLPSSSFEDKEFDSSESYSSKQKPVNKIKYPFYFSKSLPENSPLRYMSSPFEFPKKSGHRMEFYETREKLIQCPEFHPPLEDVPAQGSDPQVGETPRLINLGDKIACLRAKYFDEDPFDSPFFREKDIEYVGKQKRLKKVLNSSTAGAKSKLAHSHSQEKPIPNFKLQPHLKIASAHQVNNPNSEIQPRLKSFESKRPETKERSEEEETIMPRLKFLKKGEEKAHAGFLPLKVTPSREMAINPYLHQKPISTNRVPHAEAFKLVQTDHIDRLQPHRYVKIPDTSNCAPGINKMFDQEGIKTTIMNCSNSKFIEREFNESKSIPVVREEGKYSSATNYSDQTDWVPIIGYILPQNSNNSFNLVSRKADDVSNTTNKETQNVDSDHYVIDELVEDENVRKGEVVDDMDHYYKLLNETKTEMTEANKENEEELKSGVKARKKREAELSKPTGSLTQHFNQIYPAKEIQKNLENASDSLETLSKPFQLKRTLTRLSGKDFLNRYHSKNRKKALNNNNSSDFWKISTTNPTITSPTSTNKNKVGVNKPKEESKEKKSKQLNNKSKDVIENHNLKGDKNIQEIRKPVLKLPERNARKFDLKKTDEFREIPLGNLIPEKITKKPESKPIFGSNKINTYTPAPKINSTKESKLTTTRIISAVSETTEKYKTIKRKNEETATTTFENTEKTDAKEINDTQPSDFETKKKKGQERTGQYIETSDGPILYYVVDENTGRGQWISSHGKRKKTLRNSENGERTIKPGHKVKSINRKNIKT